ncbi:hypothetical protein SUGI_1161960 [Cryptomeria japonica]|nr:hypothetical protein SUGI_1161960 [Cryptomeria japonica]
MTRNVVVSPDKLHTGLFLERSIILQLLEDVKRIQATEEHGYLIVVTTLEGRGEGKIREMQGSVVFPVKFKCIVFKPFQNEILDGKVLEVMKAGLRIECGPMTEIFIAKQTMQDFEYVPGENPVFKGRVSHQIEKGGWIRLKTIGIKWNEQKRIFMALGSLQGNFLGPISDPGIVGKVDPETNSEIQPENPQESPTNTNGNPQGSLNKTNSNSQGWGPGENDNHQSWGVGTNDNPQDLNTKTRDNPQGLPAGTNDDPQEQASTANDKSQGWAAGRSDDPQGLPAEPNNNNLGWTSGVNQNSEGRNFGIDNHPQGLVTGANDIHQGRAIGTNDDTQGWTAEVNENSQGWGT